MLGRARPSRRIGRAACLLVIALGAAGVVSAQEALIFTDGDYDRLRVSGFLFRGNLNGSVDTPYVIEPIDLNPTLDLQDDLGFDSGGTGVFISGHLSVAKRHRFNAGFFGIGHDGVGSFEPPRRHGRCLHGRPHPGPRFLRQLQLLVLQPLVDRCRGDRRAGILRQRCGDRRRRGSFRLGGADHPQRDSELPRIPRSAGPCF